MNIKSCGSEIESLCRFVDFSLAKLRSVLNDERFLNSNQFVQMYFGEIEIQFEECSEKLHKVMDCLYDPNNEV